MLEIYDKTELLPKRIKLINDCEVAFNLYVDFKGFTEDELTVMKEIDSAVFVDQNLGTIVTKFGVTTVDSLSSGCKTVLLYLTMVKSSTVEFKEYALDITECGINAINALIDIIDKYPTKVPLVLRHENIAGAKDCSFLSNGVKEVNSLYELGL